MMVRRRATGRPQASQWADHRRIPDGMQSKRAAKRPALLGRGPSSPSQAENATRIAIFMKCGFDSPRLPVPRISPTGGPDSPTACFPHHPFTAPFFRPIP